MGNRKTWGKAAPTVAKRGNGSQSAQNAVAEKIEAPRAFRKVASEVGFAITEVGRTRKSIFVIGTFGGQRENVSAAGSAGEIRSRLLALKS
jgi:hypothetical protein